MRPHRRYFLLSSLVVLGSTASLFAWLTSSSRYSYVVASHNSLGCRPNGEGSWSIGVFYGDSPLSLEPIESQNVCRNSNAVWLVANPVFTCASPSNSGSPSNFVTDLFLFIQLSPTATRAHTLGHTNNGAANTVKTAAAATMNGTPPNTAVPWTTATINSRLVSPAATPPLKSFHPSRPRKKPQFLPCRSSHAAADADADDRLRRPDLRLVLHDSLDTSGIDTAHARVAREGFVTQIGRMSTEIHRGASIAISRGADLARAALQIAAEDDSLVSHSSVPLPVDAFVHRLDDLSMGFCSLYMPPAGSSPELFLANLDRYLYVHKGFRRITATNQSDARALYLHSVLTSRWGSIVMLALIYSEVLKMLHIYGFMDFDAEIYFPHDVVSLPRGYLKQKSKMSDQPHIMTHQSLFVEILRNLKNFFWPFQFGHASSLFLRAAHAANCFGGPSVVGEGSYKSYSNNSFEIASAKAAQHRIGRGVWTNVRFGDMRRALAACERLILLEADSIELRDYGILLYHCKYYEESLHYLKLYQRTRKKVPSRLSEELEEDAVEKLIVRLNLISMEEGWSRPAHSNNVWSSNSEPW